MPYIPIYDLRSDLPRSTFDMLKLVNQDAEAQTIAVIRAVCVANHVGAVLTAEDGTTSGYMSAAGIATRPDGTEIIL